MFGWSGLAATSIRYADYGWFDNCSRNNLKVEGEKCHAGPGADGAKWEDLVVVWGLEGTGEFE
jgi:hypothetical protein